MLNIRYSCYTVNKHECCRQISKKYLNIKFHKKSGQCGPSCSMRTDSDEEANSSFSQVCERAEKAMRRQNAEI